MPAPRVIVVIPARLASSRFPAKVLARDTGKFLIQHVWERASALQGIDAVVVAADDVTVVQACQSFGARVLLTSPHHQNGSSRLAEATRLIEATPHDLIVNIQGDEPEIDEAPILAAIAAAKSSGAHVATLAMPITSDADLHNPNIVKVVVSQRGIALYFSRSCIPHARVGGAPPTHLRHVGLYVYRADFLQTYASLAPTPAEQAEMLEQLRVLEHGYTIAVAIHHPSHSPEQLASGYGTGIDTLEQYAAFVRRYTSSLHHR